MTIHDKIFRTIIYPLINLYDPNWKIMKKKLECFYLDEIQQNKNRYYELLSENIEWFLDLKERDLLENGLNNDYKDKSRILIREFRKITNFIASQTLNEKFFENTEVFDLINDIYLETDSRRSYYYNLKFYHFDESIIKLKERIKNDINEETRLSPIHGPSDIFNFPKWERFHYELINEAKNHLSVYFDFIENDPSISHNNFYISISFIEDQYKKNIWKEGPSSLIKTLKKILLRIIDYDSLELKNSYDLTEEVHESIRESSINYFDYIQNQYSRDEIKKRYTHIRRLKSIGYYLYSLILMGSITEHILKTYYNKFNAGTEDLINRAKGDHIISNAEMIELKFINHTRNYVHIKSLIDSNDNITEKKFNLSFQVFKEVLKKMSKLNFSTHN